MERWAINRADFFNGHFQTDGVPWASDDFLGAGNREKRKVDSAMEKLRVMKANAALAKITRNGPIPDEVPEWARGPYRGNPNAN